MSGIKLCKYLELKSELIKDRTGTGNSYSNTYKYCEARKMRIPRTGCIKCKLREYEPS
jgi:hypothetical protein